MSQPSYLRLAEAVSYRLEIKKSVFVADVQPTTPETVAAQLADIRALYRGATHSCYAYTAGTETEERRFSDDGEPQGTAGLPILEVLRKRGLKNTLAVVTRWFGGVKLGAGGLAGAYTAAVAGALEHASYCTAALSRICRVRLDYAAAEILIGAIAREGGVLLERRYGADATVEYAACGTAEEALTATVRALTGGPPAVIGEKYQSYPL